MSSILMYAGQIGSGKGYISNQKIKELKAAGYSVALISISDTIKETLRILTGCDKLGNSNHFDAARFDTSIYSLLKELSIRYDVSLNDDMLNKMSEFGEMLTKIKSTTNRDKVKLLIRKAYQMLGGECVAEMNPCIWSIITARKIEDISEYIDYVIVDDFRYMHDYYTFKSILHNHHIEIYAVKSSKGSRLTRLDINEKELDEMDSQDTEKEFSTLILPYIEKYYPENIIINENKSIIGEEK